MAVSDGGARGGSGLAGGGAWGSWGGGGGGRRGGWGGRPGAGPGGHAGVASWRAGRRRVAVRAWSGGGGGWVPAPEVQELGEVVHGAQELDLGVDGVAAAVAEVAAEPGEQLGEGGLDLGGAPLVQFLPGRGGQPGGHLLPPGRQRAAAGAAAGLGGLA